MRRNLELGENLVGGSLRTSTRTDIGARLTFKVNAPTDVRRRRRRWKRRRRRRRRRMMTSRFNVGPVFILDKPPWRRRRRFTVGGVLVLNNPPAWRRTPAGCCHR